MVGRTGALCELPHDRSQSPIAKRMALLRNHPRLDVDSLWREQSTHQISLFSEQDIGVALLEFNGTERPEDQVAG